MEAVAEEPMGAGAVIEVQVIHYVTYQEGPWAGVVRPNTEYPLNLNLNKQQVISCYKYASCNI